MRGTAQEKKTPEPRPFALEMHHSTVPALNRHGCPSLLPTSVALFLQFGTRPAFYSDCISPPVRASGLEGEIYSEGGRVPIQTLFHWLFTRQESGEVNKQVLVFNCGPFIALPSSVLECSTPPFYRPSADHSANLSFSFPSPLCVSSSPFVLPRSAINPPSSSSVFIFPSPPHLFFGPHSPRRSRFKKPAVK